MEKGSVQLKLEKQNYNNMIAIIKTKSKNISSKMYGKPQLIDDCEFLEIFNKAQGGDIAALEELYYAKMLILIKLVNTYWTQIVDYDEWMEVFSISVETLIKCTKTVQPSSQKHFDNYLFKSVNNAIGKYFKNKDVFYEFSEYQDNYNYTTDAVLELNLLKTRIFDYLNSKIKHSKIDIYIKAIYERLHLLDYNYILNDILEDTTLQDCTKTRYTYIQRAFAKIKEL